MASVSVHDLTAAGSMADVPKDLREQINRLEEEFHVSTAKLKEITEHFKNELTKGLSVEGGSIPMIPTWCMGFPTGHETGTFLAVDMGGTNLRVCEVILPEEKGEFDIIQSKYRMPPELKTGTAEELWGYVADCVQQFVEYHHDMDGLEHIPLGFTFSYPVSQEYIDHGVLQRWTKGFDISGVEGQDVVPPFVAALAERGLPIKLTALVNDTTGTLIASAYTDPTVQIGCIFGTGCNAAYMEHCGSIPKLAHMNLPPSTPMAINCEWGAFDNEHFILPRTRYDTLIDAASPRPNQQAFEKLVAGYYLGEIFRVALADLAANPALSLFPSQDLAKLHTPYTLDSSFLSAIEADCFENLCETHELFQAKLGLDLTKPELELARKLAEFVGTRAARLGACGVAAIVKKRGFEGDDIRVGADGAVFEKYPHFRQRQAQALAEILDWSGGSVSAPSQRRGSGMMVDGQKGGVNGAGVEGQGQKRKRDPVEVVPAEDGSGVGAALIAALTLKRIREGNVAGIRDHEGMAICPNRVPKLD